MQKNPLITELGKQNKRGVLIILSGASGSGKDAVMKGLLDKNPNMRKLVTTNSRLPRADETEGFDYFFVSRDEFEKLISQDAFFEWVKYRGQYRGGQKQHVEEALASGHDVIWRIDVKGVQNIKAKVKAMFPHSAFVILGVKDLKTLELRMKVRASETDEELRWNMDIADWEQRQFPDFDYLVSNEDGQLEATVDLIAAIVEATRHSINPST